MTLPAPPQPADLVVSASWVLPVIPRGALYRDCACAIRDGRILALLPRAEAERRYAAAETLHLADHLLMPGLVNAHGHAAMTLLRGYADDLPLAEWLEQRIWPAEARWLGSEFVADGTRLAAAEMIASGTTCFADMYFFPEVAATVARHCGLRAQIAFPILDFPTPWAADADQCLHQGLALYDEHRGDPLLRIAFGPHAPYTVGDASFARIALYAGEVDAPIHIHLHETAREVREALAGSGERPIARLHRHGLLGPATQCVHMTQVEPGDIELLAATGARVVHCPRSNLKLASGCCPVAALRAAGIPVGLGTDGAASSNDLDLFLELRIAALLAKGLSGDPTRLGAAEAIEMATLGGATALGLDGEIGSLEPGKAADLIAVELTDISAMPLHDPRSQLVHTGSGARVSHSWVQGRPLLIERRLQTLDLPAIAARTREWQARLADPSA
ncbi:MAG: TRZ/ATZ family hydrolase [Pseudomonadota bacterium]|jgi:5-methylthioadenosine/S-adenosylhomocysteine deaminase